LLTPRITNALKGSLGEIYYKEFCDQRGWAYISLENIYESMNSDWIFTFKKGFHRIKVRIPQEIRSEITWLVKPSNDLEHRPSYVFDFLACRVGTHKNYSGIKKSDTFVLAEIKTGREIFSSNQIHKMSKIVLPLAIFHIEDILEPPEYIQMSWDVKPGKEWLDELEPIDNEVYEFDEKIKRSKKIMKDMRRTREIKESIQKN